MPHHSPLCLIIEDQIFIADYIESILMEVGCENIRKANNAEEALLQIEKHSPQIILMDINLNEKTNGIDLARQINYTHSLIYLTGQNEMSIMGEAITTNPVSYLTKPIKKTDLIAAVKLAMLQHQNNLFEIKDGHATIHICTQEVLYVKSDNMYIEIYTKNKKHIVRGTLKQFLKDIANPNIIQVHRSYLVNKIAVTKKTSQFAFIDSIKIPISRNSKNTF